MCPSWLAAPPRPPNSQRHGAAGPLRSPPKPSAAANMKRKCPPGRRSKPIGHTPPTVRHIAIACTPAHAQNPCKTRGAWCMQITAALAPRAHGIPGTPQRHKKRSARPLQFRVMELATARPHERAGRLRAQAHTRNAPHTNKLIHL